MIICEPIVLMFRCFMANTSPNVHEFWSSRLVFILAATGSAVGLGNIWKFPYITGVNGGGAFVLVYLMCIVAIGIPIMMAEIMIGRRGRKDPVNALKDLAQEAGTSSSWRFLGGIGVLAGFLILSYYSVIAGWAMAYVPKVASGLFLGQAALEVKSIFSEMVANPFILLIWHSAFIILTMGVVARGVQKGLEKAVIFLMPFLLLILLILLVYSINSGAFMQGLRFLFEPDFSKISADGVLSAMGHAFFTLSLGMGAIMVYGSYLPQTASITAATIWVAVMDTVVALVAGMVIFPIVFVNGLEPAAGPSLIFETLPLAFGHMDSGSFYGSLFFILLVFAAWTSSISLIEPAVAWTMEKFNLSRHKTCLYIGFLVWLMGLLTVFSFNLLADVTFSQAFNIAGSEIVILNNATFFDLLDYLTSNIMLPLGGLLIAIFAAWLMPENISRNELSIDSMLYRTWQILLKYVAPTAVILVFLNVLGVLTLIKNMVGL